MLHSGPFSHGVRVESAQPAGLQNLSRCLQDRLHRSQGPVLARAFVGGDGGHEMRAGDVSNYSHNERRLQIDQGVAMTQNSPEFTFFVLLRSSPAWLGLSRAERFDVRRRDDGANPEALSRSRAALLRC